MSILVGKLFEADMSKLTFVFSKDACIKTCVYFAVMFIAVMIFNTITVSKYKLINLLTATKKNEEVKIKNLENAINIKFKDAKSKSAEIIAKLDTLSPLKTLTRGYCLTEKEGKIINSSKLLNKDDEITLKFNDGIKNARIL